MQGGAPALHLHRGVRIPLYCTLTAPRDVSRNAWQNSTPCLLGIRWAGPTVDMSGEEDWDSVPWLSEPALKSDLFRMMEFKVWFR